MSATGLPLIAGRRYLFAVRAIGPEGSSSEALSDGVLVLADPCDACGVGQICVDMMCVRDPCADIACGGGTRCVDGLCVAGDADAGVPPGIDGGARGTPASGGCCSVVSSPHVSGRAALLALGLLACLGLRRRRAQRGGR